jgi:hypothetical protein
MGQIVCDRDGFRAAFLLRKGFYAADLPNLSLVKIEHCQEDLHFASFSPLRNQFLVPMLRRGRIKEILFDTFAVADTPLPIDCMARWIRHSPDGEHYAVIDTKKSVHLFDSQFHRRVWSTSLVSIAGKDHVGFGVYSADGSVVAATIIRMKTTDVVTLDASTGGILSHFVNCGCCSGFPYRGTLVIQDDRTNAPSDAARVFDLATGEPCEFVLGAT